LLPGEAEIEAKILALKPVWLQDLNIYPHINVRDTHMQIENAQNMQNCYCDYIKSCGVFKDPQRFWFTYKTGSGV